MLTDYASLTMTRVHTHSVVVLSPSELLYIYPLYICL